MLIREWAIIGLLGGLLTTLLVVSKLSRIDSTVALEQEITESSKLIYITLSGSIQQPGTYSCRPGCILKELLAAVPLSGEADHKKIPYKKVLYSSQSIEIAAKKNRPLGEKKISLEEK